MKKVIVLMLLVILAAPALGFAASPWTTETTYGDKTYGKLVFGVKNVLLGAFDLFYEPHAAQVAGKNGWSGVPKGIVDSILNVAGGAIHLVTFPIPVDVPLPDNGVNFEK